MRNRLIGNAKWKTEERMQTWSLLTPFLSLCFRAKALVEEVRGLHALFHPPPYSSEGNGEVFYNTACIIQIIDCTKQEKKNVEFCPF